MHVLVTGGAGFIGSHLTERLLADGHTVTVVDDLSTGKRDNLPSHPALTFLEKDLLDCRPEDFPGKVDALAHLAAIPSVDRSWAQPSVAHRANLTATIFVLELCRNARIPRVVFASSAAVYGDCATQPIAEAAPTHPLSPYGLQKLVSEQYAELFACHGGPRFTALRLFNVYGPRQRPESYYSGVITIFTEAMKAGRPVKVHGDGNQTRDFIYVADVAAALEAALTHDRGSEPFLACNIATGASTSILELVQALRANFPAWNEKIEFTPARTGDIRHSLADVSNARAQLGIDAAVDISEGLRRLLSFTTSNSSPFSRR